MEFILKSKLLILKRHFQSILEVLIAFVLIVLCILPLIYPHVEMYKSELRFLKKIELDHSVNLIYAKILENLYMNTYLWSDLDHRIYEIDQELLKNSHIEEKLNYIGTYNFFEEKPRFKPKDKSAPLTIYLYKLTLNFVPAEWAKSSLEERAKHTLKYQYDVFVVRDLRSPQP